MTDAEGILGNVIGALRRANFDFMVVGSFSSNFYGTPRSTQDADFVISLALGQSIRELSKYLDASIRLNPQPSFELFTGTTKYELTVDGSAFQIELFKLSDDAHDVARFQRRISVDLFGMDVWLPTPEDVIVTKLRWARPKDLDDVDNIITFHRSSLDWDYIREWTQQHGSDDALQRLLDGHGIG